MTDLPQIPAKPKKSYRDRSEICASIIEYTSTKARTKSHCMYASFLSYHQAFVEYLPWMLERGLILEHSDGYLTATERGLKFLRLFREIEPYVTKGEKKAK